MQRVNRNDEFPRNEATAVTTAIPKLDAPIVLVHGLCGFDRIYAFRRHDEGLLPRHPRAARSGGQPRACAARQPDARRRRSGRAT